MKTVRALACAGLVVVVVAGGATRAAATNISVGSRIAISPTTFALPIEIVDAVNVASWQFDVTYDPTDLHVNTTCDPFSGDVYCSWPPGPVTEGDFFASGDPFNAVPKPATLALLTTGLLALRVRRQQ